MHEFSFSCRPATIVSAKQLIGTEQKTICCVAPECSKYIDEMSERFIILLEEMLDQEAQLSDVIQQCTISR